MMMGGGVSASSSSCPPSVCSKLFNCKSQNPSMFTLNCSQNHHYGQIALSSPIQSQSQSQRPRFPRLCCSSSPGSPGSGSGEGDNKTVLDAFFLGKALGEALTERIESAVGEFLSTVGRLQAEQQKQVQDLQEDVLERAKRAKEKAAREALEAQGRLIPKTVIVNASATNGVSSSSVSTQSSSMTPAAPISVDSPSSPVSSVDADSSDQDSLSSIPIDE